MSALLELSRLLSGAGYHFVTPSPATHARVLARNPRGSQSLRDVFGWSRPFRRSSLPPDLLGAAERAEVLAPADDGWLRSRVRFSTLQGHLYVHSAYPTVEADAVFFGPDTYRFCRFVRDRLRPCRRLVDLGSGSGAGGLVAGAVASEVVLTDINPSALAMAGVNAERQGQSVERVVSDLFSAVGGPFDAVIANPPYMRDPMGRRYRDGGGDHGETLSVRIVCDALTRLPPGGQLILYTGAAVVDGRDVFWPRVEPHLVASGAAFTYEEIDPDVFGEELEAPGYAEVERIAAVGLCVTMAQAT